MKKMPAKWTTPRKTVRATITQKAMRAARDAVVAGRAAVVWVMVWLRREVGSRDG
jgi:hypothetical protein